MARGGISNGIGKGQTFARPGPWTAEEKRIGLKAFARGYAGWGFSQTFYREELFKELGFRDVEHFIAVVWEDWFAAKGTCVRLEMQLIRHQRSSISDPDDLLVLLQTWQLGDISAGDRFHGDFPAALKSIRAKTLVMPSQTDLYFPPADSRFEVENMSPGVGTLREIPSKLGHFAGAPALKDWGLLHGSIVDFLNQVESDLQK